MIGEYARVTPAELDRAVRDPEWALRLVGRRMDAEAARGTPPAKARCLDVDQAWGALGFLLARAAFPVDIVHGEDAIEDAEDWGYGPPRFLTPDRVRLAAKALDQISAEDLTSGVTPEDLAGARVYPALIWERGQSLDYVRHHYARLCPFFRTAADAGDGVLIWLG
ncbi:DUF1877 family protein [Streptomyces piniterrae]|uniref:DUF1877 family protein n=2 Tax=Streptomyces piniterrae TaxID=2571125 RepID=A0A4U0MYU9_9ACTN|nr:DUF1877 family protein [Streptomyces piniterrae]